MSTTVHLPPPLLEAVDQRARDLGVSRNRYIIRALEHAVETETRWSARFVEALNSAAADDEARSTLEEMTSMLAARRTSKGPPPL